MTRTPHTLSIAATLCLATLCETPVASAHDTRRPVHRSLSVSYFGELITHPGVALGGEHEITGSGGHSLFGGARLATYVHPGFHTGVLGSLELGYRYTFTTGLFVDARVGVGYLHAILDGDTYAPSGNGGFTRVPGASRGGFAPSAALGFGVDLSHATGAPVSLFARLDAFGQVPVNDGAVLHLATQVGVAIHFDR